ncbi:hypothetical protein SAMN05443428_10447 [Caloramator quimbayensis]|uniref:Helix-turn-helix domain-containing protein n=1 Tax=Caloramator quimbayensis TaxID=1147123 RepID=A0A1T4WWT5_9CLOT|nr:hypothetical protein [Caloramator quimbayensis]SKA81345.1 hypothetical protein SAMN05443428_10447 [Caloramator quimbayensis]
MKKKKTLSFKSKLSESILDEFDYDKYFDLAEEGFDDKTIARELNLSDKELMSLKKEAEEDY